VPAAAALTVAEECRNLLPNMYNMRWADCRMRVHQCTWFVCEVLSQMKTLQTPPVALVTALNECLEMLVEIACQTAADVGTIQDFH